MAAPGELAFEQELYAKRRVIRKDGVDCHNECEMLNIVIEKAPDSSSSTSSCNELRNRMNGGIVDGTTTKPPMIHSVQKLFRQKESRKDCFDPMVVSIGPYHHGKSELEEVERLKYSMALQFIGECKLPFCDIYSKVEQISAAARKYYPEETVSRFDENAFTTLMLVDGCFVPQFIYKFMHDHKVEHMKSNIQAFVRRDLMLLENQLPYIVLEKLLRLRFEGKAGDELIDKFIRSIRGNLFLQITWTQTTVKCFDKCYSKLKDPSSIFKKGTAYQTDQQKRAEEPNNRNQPVHLLDIFLSKYIKTENLVMRPPFNETGPDWYSYPAAKELRALGIHFRPSAGEHFTDINFISTLTAGLLFLPQIMIDDTTKSMLLNLVAYETSSDAPDDLCGLTSYICFMDSLIDQAEDVKVLRSNRIVFNLLGTDQQAAELFNDIAQDLVPNPHAFLSIKKGIELQSRSRIRNGMSESINTHFSSPWTFIAFVAATATIFLTFLQTYVSVKGYCSGKGKQDHASFCAFF